MQQSCNGSECQSHVLCCCVLLGLAAESNSDAVGEPDNGHIGVSCTGDRAAYGGDAEAQAVRTHKAADLTDDDEEHYRTRRLPAHHYLHRSLCRSFFAFCLFFSLSTH